MNNPKLIEFMNNNYKNLIKHGNRFFKNKQAAEDCVQRLYVKFLNKDYGHVQFVSSFVYTALYSQFYNFKRTNKKYKTNFFINDHESDEFKDEHIKKIE